ncbi:hypothetical protein BOX15_Mlig024874g2, partial [Macrostomum lignano]
RCRLVLTAVGRGKLGLSTGAALAGQTDPDMPLADMPDPYKKPIKKCVLCRQDVPLDYKNARLLSQFVSPYTGRIYGRHITGLCQPMQERVAELVKKSQKFGYMSQNIKETFFLSDPALFRNPLSGPSVAAPASKSSKPSTSSTESEKDGN